MSRDGLIGASKGPLDPCTLRYIEQLLKDCGLQPAAEVVHREYESVRKEIEAVIKYSK